MRHSIMILLFSLLSTYYVFSQDGKNKVIEYPAYTFCIPSTWEPYRGDSSIKKRITDKYQIETTKWNSPIKSVKDIPNTIIVSVYTYSRKDKKDLSIDEVKKRLILMSEVQEKNTVEEKIISPTQHHMVIYKKSKEMDSTPVIYNNTYTFYKKERFIYYIETSVRQQVYNTNKVKELIKNIHNSFLIKDSNRDSSIQKVTNM